MMRKRLKKSMTPVGGLPSDFMPSENWNGLHDGNSKSRLYRALVNARVRLMYLTKSGGNKSVVGLAYFFTCALLLWVGTQIPSTMSHLAHGTMDVTTATNCHTGMTSPMPMGQIENADGPALAYGVMVYQRQGYKVNTTLAQFTRMFDALYDEHNTYIVHVDIKSEPELLERITAQLDPLPNVHQIRSVSVSWAGITVVERTLALMQKALEVDNSWRYFVNLGHEDYPSASQEHVRRWLKDKPDGTNFIKCWHIEKHDFFGQTEGHESRVQDVHVDDFMGTVKEYRTVAGKPGSQDRVKTNYKFFKSLQQTMLSRQLCEYAVTDAEARRLLLYMATSKAPDELYFPTLTQLDERFSSMATCEDTRHFSYWVRPGGSWHPEYLNLDHLPLVLNASEFYIRKVEEAREAGPLLDVLDSLRLGEPLENSLPSMLQWLNRGNVSGGPLVEKFEGDTREALHELYRRQNEAVESRRCIFIDIIHRRRAARLQALSSRVEGPLTKEQQELTDSLPQKGERESDVRRAPKLPWRQRDNIDIPHDRSPREDKRSRKGSLRDGRDEDEGINSESELTGSDTGSADDPRVTGARQKSAQKFISTRVGGVAPVGTEPTGRTRGDPAVTANVIRESGRYN